MKIKSNIASMLTDNSYLYLEFIKCVCVYSDPGADLEINKKEDFIGITIKPSDPIFKQDIIRNVLGLHHLLGIKIVFSSSLAIQKNIFFTVNLVNS